MDLVQVKTNSQTFEVDDFFIKTMILIPKTLTFQL